MRDSGISRIKGTKQVRNWATNGNEMTKIDQKGCD
jgi:hypothetical protein